MNSSYINSLLKYIYMLFRFSFVSIVIIVCFVIAYYVAKYAYPFVIAFFIAMMINPIVHWMEKKAKIPRTLAVLFVMIGLFSIVFGIASLLIIEIIDGISYLTSVVPSQVSMLMGVLNTYFISHILPLWEKITHVIQTLDKSHQMAIQANLEGITNEATSFIRHLGTGIITGLTKFIVSLPSLISVIIFIFVATFFVSKDWDKMTRFFKMKLTTRLNETGSQIFYELREALLGYFRAQFALMSITGAIMYVCLTILNIDHALTIAIITALVDLLPYVGTGVVLVPWVIYSWMAGHTFLALCLSLLYIFLIVLRQLLEPKLLAASIGLNPLLTLVAVFIGFKLFSIVGLIGAPFILVFIRSLSHAKVFDSAWHYLMTTHPKE